MSLASLTLCVLREVVPTDPALSLKLDSFFVLLLLAGFAFLWLVARRFLRGPREAALDRDLASPRADNSAAVMAASMQGVIEKLREQERELARLHALEKARAEETLRLSEAVTRNMPAGLLLVSASCVITSANPAAALALGIENLQHRDFREALGAASALVKMLQACLRDGVTFQRDEIEYAAPSGESRCLGVTISPIRRSAEDPRITGALCLMSDLTELTALQKQMRLRENLASLGEMSAGIAHEFKNALATISGYAQMIRDESPSAEIAESAARILGETRALNHVVTEFLKFARPFELSPESVPLGHLVARIADEIRESGSVSSLRTEGEFSDVPGDDGLLRQALLNLIRNAAEAACAAGACGEVVISGALEERAGKICQLISISDNGPGIPPVDLDKLFLPFHTTKPEGTGLGLALVQKIILLHGGTVEARNCPAGGAEFRVWLPLKQQPVLQDVAASSSGI